MNVSDPGYWADRIAKCGGDLHRAMFEGNADQMSQVHERQRQRIAGIGIQPNDAILDIGCGYGRLLTLLPSDWHGDYFGFDISQEFITIARVLHPGRNFMVADGRSVKLRGKYKYGIALWVSAMLQANEQKQTWDAMVANLGQCTERIVAID